MKKLEIERIKNITKFVLICSVLLGSVNIVYGNQDIKQLDKQNLKDFVSFPLKVIVWSYRKVIGKGVRSFCPMYPSCSTYGLQAINSQSPFKSFLCIVDRLDRCGHDRYLYPLIHKDSKLLLYDPLPERK
ncbi:membrane protein insertion efficiency factor YidD [bacterium]|nr:membrane protein insertion efficiency factor YidD [bacterium]